MAYELIQLEYSGDFATITMNYPQRRNALSLKHMLELTDAFRKVSESGVRGVILAANGPVFSAGHDFADMVGQDLIAMRKLLKVCTTLMNTIQEMRTRHCCWLSTGRYVRPGRCLYRSGFCDPWWEGRLVLHHPDGGRQPQRWTQTSARDAADR